MMMSLLSHTATPSLVCRLARRLLGPIGDKMRSVAAPFMRKKHDGRMVSLETPRGLARCGVHSDLF